MYGIISAELFHTGGNLEKETIMEKCARFACRKVLKLPRYVSKSKEGLHQAFCSPECYMEEFKEAKEREFVARCVDSGWGLI